jgi:uncharacterized protein YuzE
MDKIKVYFDKEKDTLDVWFGEPEQEVISEEAGDGLILKKDASGLIIGIEKLYVAKSLGKDKNIPVELIVA